MKFIDEVSITVSAGNGGDGIVAWRREKYVDMGGPAGGDGGAGGTVSVEATTALSTLVEFRFKRHFAAENGKAGGGARKSGPSGKDLIIPVPVGTLVYRAAEGQSEAFLADLAEPGARVVVAKGGRGGLGNQHFATAKRQAPHFAEKGEPAESCTLRLELRLLADAGIVGVPNAGKSTLLSVISAARPKIADYPFTTLHPNLGVVRVAPEQSFVVADIPGLIEGASEGAGLGHQFLRHLQRTRLLLHIVDLAPFDDSVDPAAQAKAIVAELKKYDPELHAKPRWLVLNKLDMVPAEERAARVKDFVKRLRWEGPVFEISALAREGLQPMLRAIYEHVAAQVEQPAPPVDPRFAEEAAATPSLEGAPALPAGRSHAA